MAELHVVTALVAKRAELSGDLERLYERRDAIKAHIANLDAVLRLFCYAGDPAKIKSRRRRKLQVRVKDILKAELKRRNVSYKQLADRLDAIGIHETERNINNKISRGVFSATFFVQCLTAIGCHTLHLEDA